MFYALHIFLGSIFGFIPLLPITVLFHFVMLKKDKKKNLKTASPHIIIAYVFCLSLLSIFSATGIPSIYSLRVGMNINLVPFTDIFTNTVQYIQNILLFIPVGILLPMLWKKFEKKHLTFFYGALLSLSIEIIQIFSHRATDVDDLLMNTAGTIGGYFLFRLIKRIFPKISIVSIDNTNHWKWEPYICFALAFLSMFLIQPAISSRLIGPVFNRMGFIYN